MDQPNSEGFGNVPNASAPFGNLPQDSESFRTFPQDSEAFRTVRNVAEKTEQHTVSVRDAARAFEQAGVPRTERSIINWCQTNRQGVARLDAFFDTNERKYFITEQSIHLAIKEEQAKATANGQAPTPSVSPAFSSAEVPKDSERTRPRSEATENVENLHLQIRDLEITNRVKDQIIGRMEKDREEFQKERQGYVDRLISTSRKIGQLYTQLTMLGSGAGKSFDALPNNLDLMDNEENENDSGANFAN